MENMEYFTLRLPCSHEDKTESLQTMRKLSCFLTVARADGFLALEPFLEQETDLLIKACLLDILDGLDGTELEQRFRGYLAAGDYRGKDFLQAVVVLKGFLLLQACQTPEIFWKELQGFFGADFALEYREAFRLEQTKGK
ncbi:hypothetical protein [Caproiciproducens faecalis]|uniref:Uncharacterized protein n=1 Tax=Caproiciproducens faecalis TaxID=2820301 RepID=A0ABS7DKW9_9FIRM|nr:hypothetical protein [Caproiciproducens faecalis]MBW7571946.1 hypothetical protein [Caproiciproducens faecalis]